MNSFTGYLGDGTLRTYATGISYSSLGGMTQNSLAQHAALSQMHYNMRGQLMNMRVSNRLVNYRRVELQSRLVSRSLRRLRLGTKVARPQRQPDHLQHISRP